MTNGESLLAALERIATALERIADKATGPQDDGVRLLQEALKAQADDKAHQDGIKAAYGDHGQG